MTERSVYEQALTLLGFKARSVAELRRKLVQKGADPEEVEAVLVRLVEQKVLDDATYARQFARTKLTSGGASRHRITQELSRRGIRREAATRAIEDLTADEGVDPMAAAIRVARKKWDALASLDDLTRRRRLYGFLARRGFNPDEIRQLLNEVGSGGRA